MQRLHSFEPMHHLCCAFARRVAASAAFAILVCRAPHARADVNDAEARAHYDRGAQLFQRGDYKGALSELSEARALTHSYTILANIGQVRAAMNDYLGAIESYRQYLNEGGARLSPTQRRDADAKIIEFESRLARPTVVSDMSSTEIFVDSVRSGQAPLTLRLNPGDHEIKAFHRDQPEQQRRLVLGSGTRERIAFTFSVSAPAPVPQNPDPDGARDAAEPAAVTPSDAPVVEKGQPPQLPPKLNEVPPPTDTGRIIAWAAVGTLAAGATVTGIWALSANHSLSNLREGPEPRDRSAMESEATKTRVLATVSDGLWAGAAGLGVWLILDRSAFSSIKKTGSSKTLTLRAGLNAVSLSAQF